MLHSHQLPQLLEAMLPTGFLPLAYDAIDLRLISHDPTCSDIPLHSAFLPMRLRDKNQVETAYYYLTTFGQLLTYPFTDDSDPD